MKHQPQGLTRAFVTGIVWVGIGTAAQAVTRLAFIAVLTKHFGESLYGLWAILAAAVDLLAPLATLGLTYGYMRQHAGRADDREAHRNFIGAVVVILLMGAAVFVTFAALSGAFAGVFMRGSQVGKRIVFAGAALVLWTSLEFFLRFYFGTRLQMGRRTVLATVRFALELLATVAGVLAGWDIVRVVLLIAVARALPSLFALAAILKRNGIALPSFGRVAQAVRFGFPLQLALTAGLIMRISDRLLLGRYRPAEKAGAYTATFEIASFILLAVITLETVLFPILSALFNRGHRKQALTIYRAAVKYFLIGGVGSATVLTIAAGPILTLLTTERIAELGTSVAAMVSWGMVFYGVSILARCLLSVLHRTVPAMAATWLVALVKLALLVAFIPTFGLPAAGLITLTTFFALMVVMLVMAGLVERAQMRAVHSPPAAAEPPTTRLSILWGITGMLLAACVAGVPLHFVVGPTIPRLLAGLALFAAAYVAAVLLLRVVRVREIRTIWQIMASERPRPDAAAQAPDADTMAEPPV